MMRIGERAVGRAAEPRRGGYDDPHDGRIERIRADTGPARDRSCGVPRWRHSRRADGGKHPGMKGIRVGSGRNLRAGLYRGIKRRNHVTGSPEL